MVHGVELELAGRVLGKAPTCSFHRMASSPKILLPDPDLKMDINEVPPSPKRQLEEDTTSAQDDEELCGYAQTAVQEASPEVRAGPQPSRARAREAIC